MILSPYERISAEYEARPREKPFAYYVAWHFINGFVFSTPEFFIMGRPINKGYCERNGVPLCPPETGQYADTWYLHAFAGDMQKAWSILPYPLPYIAWERMREARLELTVIAFDRIKSLSLANERRTAAS